MAVLQIISDLFSDFYLSRETSATTTAASATTASSPTATTTTTTSSAKAKTANGSATPAPGIIKEISNFQTRHSISQQLP